MNPLNGFAFLPIGQLFCVVLVGLAFLVSSGCASVPDKDRGAARASQKGKVSKEGEKITMEELDQLTYGFAIATWPVSSAPVTRSRKPVQRRDNVASPIK